MSIDIVDNFCQIPLHGISDKLGPVQVDILYTAPEVVFNSDAPLVEVGHASDIQKLVQIEPEEQAVGGDLVDETIYDDLELFFVPSDDDVVPLVVVQE